MTPTHHAPTTSTAGEDVPDADAVRTMTVRVPDWDANWGGPRSAPHPLVRTLTISAVCPVCGGERGTPTPHPSHCDGEDYIVDTWKNPCGHLDMYEAVLVEAGINPPGTKG